MARERSGERGRREGRAGAPPDPAPWEEARRPPGERPRHERAVPEDPDDPAEAGAAIAAESWGEVIETGESVDGDYNGAPELAGVEDTQSWEGSDALDAMAGTEAAAVRESTAAEEVLAEALAARRELLLERLDEARELGLEAVVTAALEASEPAAGDRPVVSDEDELHVRLEQVDAAIEELERRSAGAPAEAAARVPAAALGEAPDGPARVRAAREAAPRPRRG